MKGKIDYAEATNFAAEGMSINELSELYGVTDSAVRNGIFRMRDKVMAAHLPVETALTTFGISKVGFDYLCSKSSTPYEVREEKMYESANNHSISSYCKPNPKSEFPEVKEDKTAGKVVNAPKAGIAALRFDTDNMLEFVGKPNYYILDASDSSNPVIYKLEDISISKYKELSEKEMCVFFSVYPK